MEYEPPVPTPDELHREAKAMQEYLKDELRAEAQYREYKEAMLRDTQVRLHRPGRLF